MRITLNLLPPANKAAMHTGFIFGYVQSILIVFLVMTLFAAGTLFAVRFLLRGTYDDLAKRSSSDSDEFKNITDEIRKINLYLQRIEGLHEGFTPWSSMLSTLAELVPDNAKIDRVQVNANGAISLGGTALTRDDVLMLEQRLVRSGLFKDVKSPLSNILQQKNVHFDFEMTYIRPQPK